MPPSRPYIQKSAKELDALFEAVKDDFTSIKLIFAELKHRSTPSACALRLKVEKYLKSSGKLNETERPKRPAESPKAEQSAYHVLNCKGCNTRIRIPIKDDCILYRCPKCQLLFEAEHRAGVMEIVFLMEESKTADVEHITEEAARSILGVSANARFAEIKAAWRRLSQQYHPDKHQALPERLREAAEVEVSRINQAYQILVRVTAEEF